VSLAAESLHDSASARIGSMFRLLMQIRVLLAGLSLLLVPFEREHMEGTLLLVGLGALSFLAAFSWREIVTWLLRHQVLIGFEVFVCFAVLYIGGVLGPFFLSTVITSAVVGLLFSRRDLLLVCGLQMSLYYAALAGEVREALTFQTLVAMPAFYLVAGFTGMKLRRLFEESRDLEYARRRAEVLAAAAEERARLAREMHDSLAKTLRGIAMAAGALPTWVRSSPHRAETEACTIAAAAEEASREARKLIGQLRTYPVDRPLGESLRNLVDAWAAKAGVAARVSVRTPVEPPLGARHEMVAIVQEALENVARHADASAVEVSLTEAGGRLSLTVRDDGNGFEPPDDPADLAGEGHYGVIGMRERAATVGADLRVESTVGGGTAVTVGLPVVPSERVADRRAAPALRAGVSPDGTEVQEV
jgi:signal transduction histidine kinase